MTHKGLATAVNPTLPNLKLQLFIERIVTMLIALPFSSTYLIGLFTFSKTTQNGRKEHASEKIEIYNQSFKKFRKRASLISFFIKLTSYINHCFGRVFGWYQVSFRSTFSFYQILPFQNSHIVFSLFLRNGENSFPNFYYYRSLKLVIIIMVIADVAQAQVSRMLLMNLFLKAKLTIKKDHHQLREGSYLSLNSRL